MDIIIHVEEWAETGNAAFTVEDSVSDYGLPMGLQEMLDLVRKLAEGQANDICIKRSFEYAKKHPCCVNCKHCYLEYGSYECYYENNCEEDVDPEQFTCEKWEVGL